MKHSMILGAVVRDLRKGAGITQGVLARHLGLKQAAISRKESGLESFTFDQFCEAAPLLRVSRKQLIAQYERAVG